MQWTQLDTKHKHKNANKTDGQSQKQRHLDKGVGKYTCTVCQKPSRTAGRK